jgi:hypothetical protein
VVSENAPPDDRRFWSYLFGIVTCLAQNHGAKNQHARRPDAACEAVHGVAFAQCEVEVLMALCRHQAQLNLFQYVECESLI